MKITNVSVTLFPWKGLEGATDAAYQTSIKNNIYLGLVTIDTDEGISGYSMLGSSVWSAEMDAKSIIDALKPVLIGEDPFMRESIYKKMISWQRRRLTTLRAIGAVDIALWDLVGKVMKQPIWRIIGGFREKIPAYASSQVLPSIEAYEEEIAFYKEKGWKAYKIHPPTISPGHDIELCRRARKAAGDGYDLMLDSMWSYTYPEAVKVGKALEDLEFTFFEDPLKENDIYNYQKLCNDLSIPVMATEYPSDTLDSYVPWLIMHATDYLRGDVAVKGGITGILKAARLAEAFNMSFEIHHGANSLNNVANLNVALAIPNCTYFEIMLPDVNQKYGMIEEIEVDAEGMVSAPKGFGLGMEIDHERIIRDKEYVLQ